MTSPYLAVADELFKQQIKHHNGRYDLQLPLMASERLNWVGSKHWALLQNLMVKHFGDSYYVYDYQAGKMWGHMFCGGIVSLVKTKQIVAEMMGLISEHLGFGKIEAIRLGYAEDWATLRFHDSPTARESAKLFGYSSAPIDYSIAGLIAGSAESVLKRKFITFETSCIGVNDSVCTFQTLGIDKARELSGKLSNEEQKRVYAKIMEVEDKTDFGVEAAKLLNSQDANAVQKEKNYLASL